MVHSYLPLKRWAGRPLVLSLHDYSLLCGTKRLQRMGVQRCPGPAPGACIRCSSNHYGVVKGTLTIAARFATAPLVGRAVDRFLPVSKVVARRSGLVDSDLAFEVIPNFVRRTASSPAESEVGHPPALPADPYILYAGDISRQKGVDVLLRAYRRLRRPPPLVLVGRVVDVGPVADEGVHVVGPLPRRLMAQALRRAVVAVAPSVWEEPFGLVVLEAMAGGRPVIVSSAGFLGDLVTDDVNGLVTPPGDDVALENALARLLGDAALRARLGEAAQREALRYDARVLVPRFEHVYDSLQRPRAI